jgi:orotidine-5'-phosphate decarboxylase
MKNNSASSRLILALDLDSPQEALDLAQKLQGKVGVFKVGPRFVMRAGPEGLEKLRSCGEIFLDCKFHDIPSTMESAVRTSFELGASLVTVHASAGREALKLMAQVESELSQQRKFRILAVTVLTSFSEEGLPKNWQIQSMQKHVLDLVSEVRASGLTAVVCSPHELEVLKNQGLFLVTPGVRFPEEAGKDDQKRIMSPSDAIGAGASAVVVGRPILQAKDPLRAVERYLHSLEISGA